MVSIGPSSPDQQIPRLLSCVSCGIRTSDGEVYEAHYGTPSGYKMENRGGHSHAVTLYTYFRSERAFVCRACVLRHLTKYTRSGLVATAALAAAFLIIWAFNRDSPGWLAGFVLSLLIALWLAMRLSEYASSMRSGASQWTQEELQSSEYVEAGDQIVVAQHKAQSNNQPLVTIHTRSQRKSFQNG